MKFDIQTVGFHATPELEKFTSEKAEQLTKYFPNITGIDIYLKTEYNDEDETKTAEMKVFVPGPSLFASHKSDNFNESIVEVIDKLKRQLKKVKAKQYLKR